MSNEKRGSLLLISFDDLIMKFAKGNDLANYSILIASHEISGSLHIKTSLRQIRGVANGIKYQSKYDNIEFVDSLRPTATNMEYCYADQNKFADLYRSQLLDIEPLRDLCAIVDMIVNNNCDVIIVMAAYETAGNVLEHLQMFIQDEFFLRGYTFKELERLSSSFHNKELYQKVLKSINFEVPEDFDGEDFEVILKNYGDRQKIIDQLEVQKNIVTQMLAGIGEDPEALENIYYNRITEQMEDALRETLLRRSLEDLKEMCRMKKIRIGLNATPEQLVEKILSSMKLTSKRIVEYES